MRPFLSASLMAIVAVVSISACSSSSNSSTNSADNSATTTSAAADNSATTTDNSAASGDTSAAAAPAGANVYPGAKTDTPPGASGTPPPGVAGYSTTDGPDKVTAWYKANLAGAKLVTSSAQGSVFQSGDTKTGTLVMIQAAGGKTYIITGPASALAH
jgi:ABC-type Fe3+-hydroxamate transport system substrate-binding protein